MFPMELASRQDAATDRILMENEQNTNYLTLAILTCLVWDLTLTLDDGINLFRKKWNIASALFWTNRTFSLICSGAVALQNLIRSPSYRYCLVAPWFELAGSIILIATIGCVMMIRVYALWNRSIIVLIIMVTAYLGNLTVYTGLLGKSYSTMMIIPNVLPYTGCTCIPTYTKTWISFVIVITFETIIVSLIIIRAYPILRWRGVKAPLYMLLFEDGLAYYLGMVLSKVACLIAVWQYNTITAPILGSYPTIAIGAIACNRILLRPQKMLLSQGTDFTTSFRSEGLRTAAGITLEFRKKPDESYLARDLPGERLPRDDKSSSGIVGTNSGSSSASKKPTDLLRMSEDAFAAFPPRTNYEVHIPTRTFHGVSVQREEIRRIDGISPSSEPSLSEVSLSHRDIQRNVLDSNTTQDNGAIKISRIGRYD